MPRRSTMTGLWAAVVLSSATLPIAALAQTRPPRTPPAAESPPPLPPNADAPDWDDGSPGRVGSPAQAASAPSTDADLNGVYRWVDAHGEVHYTNDAAEIPKGTRPTAVKGGTLSEISHHSSGAGASGSASVAAGPTRGRAPPARSDEYDHDSDIPSQAETYWRGRFREAHQTIADLEQNLEADRARAHELAPFYGRCRPGSAAFGYPAAGCQASADWPSIHQRIREEQNALNRAQQDLEELERQASFKAVPREWRQ